MALGRAPLAWPSVYSGRMRWWAVTVGLVVGGCGRTDPISFTPVIDAGWRDAGVDAGADAGRRRDGGLPMVADGGAPTSCANEPGPGTQTRCFARVRLEQFTPSSPTCFVDVRVRVGEEGAVDWDCGETTGRASITFPNARFTGVVTERNVDVCSGTEFDWTDGCHWSSAQTIRGSLSDQRLRLTYAEAPLAMQLGCVVPCSASGTLLLLPP